MPLYSTTLQQLGFSETVFQPIVKGRVSSLSCISRQLFKAHYDGYHPRVARQLVTALKRYISARPKHERRTPAFVGEIRRKILCLHEYNVQIAKVKYKYPRSEQFDSLLVQYVELECGLMNDAYRGVDEESVTQRVLRLLQLILHDALQNGDVSLKATSEACDKTLLKLFASVRVDCASDNKLVANTITKLLSRLNLIEEVNKLKGRNIPFYQDTFLKDPVVSTIRQTLETSDYYSDDDSDDDIEIVPTLDDLCPPLKSRTFFNSAEEGRFRKKTRENQDCKFLKNFQDNLVTDTQSNNVETNDSLHPIPNIVTEKLNGKGEESALPSQEIPEKNSQLLSEDSDINEPARDAVVNKNMHSDRTRLPQVFHNDAIDTTSSLTKITNESVNNSIVTIEIDDDDDDDDNNGVSLNTANLLQLNEIKLEENEENQSPNFPAPNSDNKPNFLGSEKPPKSPDSTAFNKKNNSGGDSTQETDTFPIVISDSEDEVMECGLDTRPGTSLNENRGTDLLCQNTEIRNDRELELSSEDPKWRNVSPSEDSPGDEKAPSSDIINIDVEQKRNEDELDISASDSKVRTSDLVEMTELVRNDTEEDHRATKTSSIAAEESVIVEHDKQLISGDDCTDTEESVDRPRTEFSVSQEDTEITENQKTNQEVELNSEFQTCEEDLEESEDLGRAEKDIGTIELKDDVVTAQEDKSESKFEESSNTTEENVGTSISRDQETNHEFETHSALVEINSEEETVLKEDEHVTETSITRQMQNIDENQTSEGIQQHVVDKKNDITREIVDSSLNFRDTDEVVIPLVECQDVECASSDSTNVEDVAARNEENYVEPSIPDADVDKEISDQLIIDKEKSVDNFFDGEKNEDRGSIVSLEKEVIKDETCDQQTTKQENSSLSNKEVQDIVPILDGLLSQAVPEENIRDEGETTEEFVKFSTNNYVESVAVEVNSDKSLSHEENNETIVATENEINNLKNVEDTSDSVSIDQSEMICETLQTSHEVKIVGSEETPKIENLESVETTEALVKVTNECQNEYSEIQADGENLYQSATKALPVIVPTEEQLIADIQNEATLHEDERRDVEDEDQITDLETQVTSVQNEHLSGVCSEKIENLDCSSTNEDVKLSVPTEPHLSVSEEVEIVSNSVSDVQSEESCLNTTETAECMQLLVPTDSDKLPKTESRIPITADHQSVMCQIPLVNTHIITDPSVTSAEDQVADARHVTWQEVCPQLNQHPIIDERKELPPETIIQQVSPDNGNMQPSLLYTLSSTISQVQYSEYNTEKKVSGDLELLANIAAHQETLAVKTDSEKETFDASSDAEVSTPKRRRSKVKFDTKKKTLARETLYRAARQSQRKANPKQKSQVEEPENKRITRNKANKTKIEPSKASRIEDSNYKPHDFISMENATLPARTNNVYAQKRLMEANTTSEDSNDSCESTLFIDLGENFKNSEKSLKSVYEEDTVCDMLEFVTTDNKECVCISIPENEETCESATFHILKQMEDFVENNHQEVTDKIRDAQEIEVSVVASVVNEQFEIAETSETKISENDQRIKISKTTDHSIENILNKSPTVETKVFVHSFSNENEEPVHQNSLKISNEASESNGGKDQVEIPREDVSVSAEMTAVPDHSEELKRVEEDPSLQPEDLTIEKTRIVTENSDEHNEKTFKTKAAVKSYEDKLQPNPYVLLHQYDAEKTLGMQTRSRSRSSETVSEKTETVERSRSASLDCGSTTTDEFNKSLVSVESSSSESNKNSDTQETVPEKEIINNREPVIDEVATEDAPSAIPDGGELESLVSESTKVLEMSADNNEQSNILLSNNHDAVITETTKEIAISGSETQNQPNSENLSQTSLEPTAVAVKELNAKKHPDKTHVDKGTKGRSLENTIKKMKERVKEKLSSTKEPLDEKTLELSKDKSVGEKKHQRKPASEEREQKSVETSRKEGNRSRSSSKSRVSEKKLQEEEKEKSAGKSSSSLRSHEAVEKEKSGNKASPSRSSSKSRSTDKHAAKHYSERQNDHKRRSKSRSLDKDKTTHPQEGSHNDRGRHSESRSLDKNKMKHSQEEKGEGSSDHKRRSKSRSLDKDKTAHPHEAKSENHSDNKRRSKTRSLDKDKALSQEERSESPNDHKKSQHPQEAKSESQNDQKILSESRSLDKEEPSESPSDDKTLLDKDQSTLQQEKQNESRSDHKISLDKDKTTLSQEESLNESPSGHKPTFSQEKQNESQNDHEGTLDKDKTPTHPQEQSESLSDHKKSLDNDKTTHPQEEANDDGKKHNEPSPKSSLGKSKHGSRQKHEEKEDNHKKPKSKMHEKERSHAERKKSVEKAKAEEPKSKTSNKGKQKKDESSSSQSKKPDENVLKSENKSSRSRSKKQSTPPDEAKRVEEGEIGAHDKQESHKSSKSHNPSKNHGDKSDEKNRHRDSHKSKSKEKENQFKNDPQKKNDHSKTRRSCSREKTKSESGSRSEKRDKSSKDAGKDGGKQRREESTEIHKEKKKSKKHRESVPTEGTADVENKDAATKVDIAAELAEVTIKNEDAEMPKKRKHDESSCDDLPKVKFTKTMDDHMTAENLQNSVQQDTITESACANSNPQDKLCTDSEISVPENNSEIVQNETHSDSREKSTSVDLTYENFSNGIKVSSCLINEASSGTLVEEVSTVNESPQSQNDEVSSSPEVDVDVDVDVPTETKVKNTVLLNENIPISSSESVYINAVFSASSSDINVQMLSTSVDSTVKHLVGHEPDLSLIPTASIAAIATSATVTSVSMPMTIENVSSSTTDRFSFNKNTETDNRENLHTSDLFHTSVSLGDISPTKLPLASNQSLDFNLRATSISEINNSVNLVQTLGSSSINFEVSDTSEIDIQQTNKPNTFGDNFVRRVTEIRCFMEKEAPADHNYTLSDPLVGGNNEDKNILTTGLSLTNSPEEFQLNESHLEDLSFNENNFIEENGTLEDLALLLPCKKEKPDFDNIIDETMPKPEDIQNSIKRLNMLADISQNGQPKTVSVDNTIDQASTNDRNVGLGIDYAVSELLFLGGGEVTTQNNSFSAIPDIDNINIMESNDSSVHPPKQTIEEAVIETRSHLDNSFPATDPDKKVVVEPIEQCSITSFEQLKKDYIAENLKSVEKTKPSKPKGQPSYRTTNFATFLELVKRDANKSEQKAKDEIENGVVRKYNRTPVVSSKKKNVAPQQPKTDESKAQCAAENAKGYRTRVRTDLMSHSASDCLEYINEHDQNVASEVVLPFNKPSPSEIKTDATEKKENVTKHTRFDKMGKDYIMENILNVYSDPKAHKSPVSEKDMKTDLGKKRKSVESEAKQDEKRQKKSNDDESRANKPSNDEIFDKLLEEGPVNKIFVQKMNEQNVIKKENSVESQKPRGYFTSEGYFSAKKESGQLTRGGYLTVPDPHKKDNGPQSTAPVGQRYRYSGRSEPKKFGYYSTNHGAQLDRKFAEKRHISLPVVDTSPKRSVRCSGSSYNSKSDPSTTRDYKARDRRMSTEHPNNIYSNSSKGEGSNKQDDDKFSWLDRFNGTGLFDTPSGLFTSPGGKRGSAAVYGNGRK